MRFVKGAGVGAAFGALVLGVLACTGGAEKGGRPALLGGEPADLTETPVEAAAPPDFASLGVQIGATAPEGSAPLALTVSLARPLRADAGAGTPAVGSKLTLEPAVDGELKWSGPSGLVFQPAVGFAPGTAYEVALTELAGPGGPVAIPADAVPKLAFTTPPFQAVRASVVGWQVRTRQIEAEIAFSGPVDEASAAKLLTATVNGAPAKVTVGTGGPHRLRVSVPVVAEKGTVALTLAAGAKSAVTPEATAPSSTLEVPYDVTFPAVDVKAIRPVETGDGYVLEVICSDAAAGETRYWRDNSSARYAYFYLSPRCALDPERAAEWVHVSPEVPNLRVVESSGGFRIFGDFARGGYVLRIDAGARTVDGGGFRAVREETVEITARKPRVEMVASQGRYLPRSAWGSLPVRHLNVSEVKLRIRHVPPQNMVFWLTGSESADGRTSDLVVDTKIAVSSEPDTLGTTWVDLGKVLPGDKRGLYEVTVVTPDPPPTPVVEEEDAEEEDGEDTDGSYVPPPPPPQSDASRLVLTDLQLVAKSEGTPPGKSWPPKIWVWSLDVATGGAESGVLVEAVRSSGKKLATCTTGGDGGCVLELPERDVDPAGPVALLASKGDDLTYLKFADLQVPLSESQVGGEPYQSTVPYRASMWTERGVYRPGETVHLAATLRTRTNAAPPADLPVTVKFLDSRRKTMKQAALRTNPGGLVAVDLPLAAFASTGSWEAVLEVAGKPIASEKFNVEEFVPERMRVTAAASVEDALAADPVSLDISAKYLFGGSAAGSPVEIACHIETATFVPGGQDRYQWGVARHASRPDEQVDDGIRSLGTTNAEIGEDDHVRASCPEVGAAPAGPSRVVADISVFEAGSGRTTRAATSWRVHPAKTYIGMTTGTRQAEVGTPFTVDGVVVDWEGKPVSAVKIQVEIYDLQEEWGWWWYWEWQEYQEDWLRHLRASFSEKRTVEVGSDGRFSLDVTPRARAAGYEVRAIAGEARTELMVEGSARSYWSSPGARESTPRPLAPTAVSMTAPERGVVGEPIEVEIVAEWPGRVLFTAETDQVLATEWVDVAKPGAVKWKFIPNGYADNVYVSALAVKDPHLLSPESYVPDRGFAVRSVRLEPTAYQMAVTLDTPAEIRSNSTLQVGIDLGPQNGPTWVTVAAVDEGILSLTKFPTPDPIPDLFPSRRLGVSTYETIGWTMMLPPAGASSATGGDAEGAAGRVQPVKAVALWSGPVEVDNSGKATVELAVPQYRGELRVMVMATNADRVGSASAQVVVRDPLVIQTTMPRFLTTGDAFQVPVFVTNTSGKKRTITVKLAAEAIPVPGIGILDPISPLELTSKPEATFSLGDGESKTVAFAARAIAPIGAARLRVVATSDGGLTSQDEVEVPFSPNAPRERVVQRVALTDGKLDLKPLLQGWVPTTESTQLWITPNPYGESLQHLAYLIHYPYGCIEQTTSSARPLLYVRNLLPAIDPKLASPERIDDMVKSGIDRIFSMQTSSGGFGYWPGENEPSYWGTAYATHFLLDAVQAGYDVPQDRIDDAIAFLAREADKSHGSTHDVHYGWFDAEPYIHYVLARGGKPRKARIESLLGTLDRSRAEAKEDEYLLQAALYLAGDRRYEKALRSPTTAPLTSERHNHWGFWSDLRARGMMLSVNEDLFGANDAGSEPLAQLVARGLAGQGSRWYTTQEIVWGTTALGKRVANSTSKFGEPVLSANGKALKAEKLGADRTFTVWRASELSSLELDVPSVGDGKLYLVISSQGVRTNGTWKTGGASLALTREFLDAEGDPISWSDHALGDLVYTRVKVTNTTNERIQNLALVDRLPAGWEIENPRLGRSNTVDWIDPEQAWQADHMNLRDDRLELFGALDPKETREVVYAVRAVTAGTFTIPPVEIEAMYDPNVWARAAGMQIEVQGPFAQFLL
jgi:uncharacterized protein YfaS (alpha-2-macroglobulin family)